MEISQNFAERLNSFYEISSKLTEISFYIEHVHVSLCVWKWALYPESMSCLSRKYVTQNLLHSHQMRRLTLLNKL